MLTVDALLNLSLPYIDIINRLLGKSLSELREMALNFSRTKELIFFAPMYVSSACQSTCAYCAFRKGNKIKRRTLTFPEAQQEVAYLKEEGYSAVYCLSGSFPEWDINRRGSMTEVNARGLRAIHEAGLFPVLESSPFSEENFAILLEAAGGNGRFVLFQECYGRHTYEEIHGEDVYKGDPDARLQQLELALKAGWPELGIGFLIGLHHDVIPELACLLAHYDYLMQQGARAVTISVPRINEATGIDIRDRSSDECFMAINYIIKILRPGAQIVLTGRETETMRDTLRPVTDIWGVKGSTVPGGYTLGGNMANGQFSLCDRRSIDELGRS